MGAPFRRLTRFVLGVTHCVSVCVGDRRSLARRAADGFGAFHADQGVHKGEEDRSRGMAHVGWQEGKIVPVEITIQLLLKAMEKAETKRFLIGLTPHL